MKRYEKAAIAALKKWPMDIGLSIEPVVVEGVPGVQISGIMGHMIFGGEFLFGKQRALELFDEMHGPTLADFSKLTNEQVSEVRSALSEAFDNPNREKVNITNVGVK